MRLWQFLNEYRVKKRNVATSTNGDVSYNSAWLKDLWSKCNEQYFHRYSHHHPIQQI